MIRLFRTVGLSMLAAALLANAAVPATAATAHGAQPVAQHHDAVATAADQPFAGQQAAGRTERTLRARLGAAFVGAWLDPATHRLRVALTDPAQAGAVQQAGASPTVVTRSAAELRGLRAKVDALAGRHAPPAVTRWFVDPATDSVVVRVEPGTPDSATQQFLDKVAALGDGVRVVRSDGQLGLRGGDLVGGNAIFIGNAQCSLGFSAKTPDGATRVLTAGHCTAIGGNVTGANGTLIGPITNSNFSRAGDFGAFAASEAWRPTPTVDTGTGTVTVTGAEPAPVGGQVCRSGSTSGYHCGTITATGVTANYSQGVVEGLTETSACSEAGDSGGPFVAGSQAQGVLSGGTGDCGLFGGSTVFQPVPEILSTLGLTLVTG